MNRIVSPVITILLTIAITVSVTGCSFKSFSASSRSSSSPSRWLSASSRSGGSSSKSGEASVRETQSSFQEEISALAVLYAKSSGTASDFESEVTSAARRHGISVWEDIPATYRAIGVGLARAGVPRDAIDYLPFLKDLKTSRHYGQILSSHAR